MGQSKWNITLSKKEQASADLNAFDCVEIMAAEEGPYDGTL